MPLLVSYPRRVVAGQVHTGITTSVDFARTLLEAAGVPAHHGYRDEAYAQVREDVKVRQWRAQEGLGEAPHPRQPRPAGFTERD